MALRQPIFLDPTTIDDRLGPRYARHPGPYSIQYGGRTMKDKGLFDIFPGMEEIPYNPDEFPLPEYGDMNGTEREVLVRILQWLQPRTLLEYGTNKGRSTAIMTAKSPENARILTVDLPDDQRGEFANPDYSTDTAFMSGEVGVYYKGTAYERKITQVRMDARSNAFERVLDKWLGEEKIDFALVDAAHDYKTTRQLFKQAEARLRHGGVILTDDYGAKAATHIGTIQALAELGREGFPLYWFNPRYQRPEAVEPLYKRPEYKDFSAVLFVNVPRT
jgi:predicted O-methyltransferase YrrM